MSVVEMRMLRLVAVIYKSLKMDKKWVHFLDVRGYFKSMVKKYPRDLIFIMSDQSFIIMVKLNSWLKRDD